MVKVGIEPTSPEPQSDILPLDDITLIILYNAI